MTDDEVEELLGRMTATQGEAADTELGAVRTALLVEDLFGVTLSDAEIDPRTLGDPAGIRQLLVRHGVLR